MSKGLESIVASFDLCTRIPAGEFKHTAMVWRERIGYISSSVGLKFRDPEDISYKVESTKVNYFPAPTAGEIMMKLNSPSLWHGSTGRWYCMCKEHVMVESGENASEAALRLWLRVKRTVSK